MIRPLRTLATGAVAAGLVVALAASPAEAKTRSFADKAGDAAPSLDVTKVTVTNKKRAVVIRLSVPGLRTSQVGGVMVGVRTKAKGRPTFTAFKMRLEGAGWMPLMFTDEDSDDLVTPCKGDRVRFNKASITVRIPQRCLGADKVAVRVMAAVLGRGDELFLSEEAPQAGPDADLDAYPSITSSRMSPWVGYR